MRDLPALKRIQSIFKNPGDYMSITRTKSDRIVAKAKLGSIKQSKVLYPSGRIVETKSYKW